MKLAEETLQLARQVLEAEASAIIRLSESLDESFHKAVRLIYESKGRVVVTGVGKSAIIATKIVSTLNSTGTPALFMHAADAVHGDLGMIQKDDVVLCISNSGNTPEIRLLVPWIKSGGNPLIAMAGNISSFLAKEADIVLNAMVEQEACPHNLAPTSSTTAQLALGDALAVCLLACRKFSPEDFAKYHPGGTLGKRLYLRMSDLYTRHEKPEVRPDASLKEVIVEISSKRLGATAVVNENGNLSGMITDGDLRRLLQRTAQLDGLRAVDIMNKTPKTIAADTLAITGLELMRENKITQLIVLEGEHYAGMVHIHDLNQEGLII
ncbi:MAG: KpsF/GutQ family sugar-phosphate isomerase [Bacteroidota bacterium]|nr:KpsF/GutQ family sugar-phosphate isomerase [Bacteroidota bacterium]